MGRVNAAVRRGERSLADRQAGKLLFSNMSDFSLELNEDQLQIQKWVHDFAENVDPPGRPRVGRAGRDPVADHRGGGQDRPLLARLRRQRLRRPDRASRCPLVMEEMCLGRRRHRPRHLRHHPRRRRHHRQRHARADRGVGAAVLRHAREDPARRLRRERARRRLRRELAAHAGPSTTRPRTSGCSTAPRRGSPTAASPTSTWSSPSVEPELGSRGQASFVVPPGHPGLSPGPEVQEDGHPRVAHRRGHPRRLPRARVAACSAARRSSTSAWPAPARARARRCRRPWRPSRRPAPRSARRPSASPAPPTSTRSTTPRSASSSAGRSSRTRRSPSSSPT